MKVEMFWKIPGRYFADDCDCSVMIGQPVNVDGAPGGKVVAARPKDGGLLVAIELNGPDLLASEKSFAAMVQDATGLPERCTRVAVR